MVVDRDSERAEFDDFEDRLETVEDRDSDRFFFGRPLLGALGRPLVWGLLADLVFRAAGGPCGSSASSLLKRLGMKTREGRLAEAPEVGAFRLPSL